MKQARAEQAELEAVLEFFQSILELFEDGADDLIAGHVIEHAIIKPRFSIERIIWGYRAMFDAVCNPNADTLELKPELAKVISENTSID